MTKREFEQLRNEISQKIFLSTEMDPLIYGINRLLFEKAKLKQLITAAETVGLKTTSAMATRWKRKVGRADVSLARFVQERRERDLSPQSTGS